MKRNLVVSVVLTCLVCFGAFAAAVASNWKPLLGLDLQGGLSVVYCPAAKHSVTKCASGGGASKKTLSDAVGILQERANAYGVSQPNINLQGDDIVVQVPGAKNARSLEKKLGSTAQLYFRPVLCLAPPYTKPSKASTTTTTTPSSTTTTTPAKTKGNKKGGSTTTSPTTSPTTSTSSTTTSTTSTTATTSPTTSTTTAGSSTTTTAPSGSTTTTTAPGTGKAHHGKSTYTYPPACPSSAAPTESVRTPTEYTPLATFKTTPPGYDDPTKNVILYEQGTGQRMELGPAQARGTDISSAVATYQAGQGYIVQFNLTKSGTVVWDDLANNNYQKIVGDDLGGVVISAPSINDKGAAFGSSGEVSGGFTQSQANALAINLNYGALPITLAQVTSQIVSPSLGASSLHAGLLAGLLGLLLVMLYTIFYYRALGIVVVLGLVTTAALLYGIISALGHSSFQLTLDLSGITGLIVSVGITVDSYIVYFERLKDEVRAGRSVRASVDRGFKSAYRTILSADAVSFIGALVLWWLSVGAVRGFAFMLGLSTIIDVATAYCFTRPLVILLGRNRIFTEARGLGVARGLGAAPTEADA